MSDALIVVGLTLVVGAGLTLLAQGVIMLVQTIIDMIEDRAWGYLATTLALVVIILGLILYAIGRVMSVSG